MQLLKTVPLGAVTPILCYFIICTCLFNIPLHCAWLEGGKKERYKRSETCSLKLLMKPFFFHLQLEMDIIENKTRKEKNML